MPLPLKYFPRSGEDVALATERGTRWHGVSRDGEGERLPLRGSWHREAMTERVYPQKLLRKADVIPLVRLTP